MKVIQLQWDESDDLDNHDRHVIEQPTIQDIEEAFRRLDGLTFPSIVLKTSDYQNRYPTLIVIGGAGSYSATLEFRDASGIWTGECIITINPELYGPPKQEGGRAIGRGYHNFEIPEYEFIEDSKIIWQLIKHFIKTARWDFNVPFAVENVNIVDYGYGREEEGVNLSI